jgi:hypothetical protein
MKFDSAFKQNFSGDGLVRSPSRRPNLEMTYGRLFGLPRFKFAVLFIAFGECSRWALACAWFLNARETNGLKSIIPHVN